MQSFVDKLNGLVEGRLAGRVLRIRVHEDTRQVFVNFYNLPEQIVGYRAGGGAEAENNRVMFTLEFLPNGKVKCDCSVNAVGSQRPRGKTAKPERIAEYVGEYLLKVVETIPPKFTHTRVDKHPEVVNI